MKNALVFVGVAGIAGAAIAFLPHCAWGSEPSTHQVTETNLENFKAAALKWIQQDRPECLHTHDFQHGWILVPEDALQKLLQRGDDPTRSVSRHYQALMEMEGRAGNQTRLRLGAGLVETGSRLAQALDFFVESGMMQSSPAGRAISRSGSVRPVTRYQTVVPLCLGTAEYSFHGLAGSSVTFEWKLGDAAPWTQKPELQELVWTKCPNGTADCSGQVTVDL